MADSVRERVMQDLATTLATVSVANGYEHDFPGGVQRFQQDGTSFVNYPGILVTMVAEKKESVNIDLFDCVLEVAVEVFAIDTATVNITESTAGYVDGLVQDVERALSLDPTRSALCTDSSTVSIAPFGLAGGVPYVGCILNYIARYRHSRTDPSEAR